MVIIVTGASSGLGYAIAQKLGEKGNRVYGVSRKGTPNPTKQGHMWSLHMDVQQDESVTAAIALIIAKEGRIDAVINNAGCGIGGSVEDTPLGEAKNLFDVNYFGVVRMMSATLPYLRESHGYMLNVSSIAGLLPLSYQAHYSASKFAVEGLTQSLRKELLPFGVKVALLAPGDFKTNFTASRKLTTGENSTYYPHFQKALAVMEKEENEGLSPEVAAKMVCQLLRKKRWRVRYVISNKVQRLAIIVQRLLGDNLFEKIMMKFYG